MKKIITTLAIISGFALVMVGCGRSENESVTSPDKGAYSSRDNDGATSPTVVFSGLIHNRRSGGNVPIQVDSALLVLSFPKNMRTSATVVLKYVATNTDVAVSAVWDIGTNYSTLKIQPTAALQLDKRYWLKIVASSIVDAQGNLWDRDGDGIGGEKVDDDYMIYFNTQNSTGGAGNYTDSAQYVRDEWAPTTLGSLFCYYNNTEFNSTNVDVDASFYLRFRDEDLRLNRAGKDTVFTFNGILNASNIWLVDGINFAKVAATVVRVADPDTSIHVANSAVRITPTAQLAPFKTYYVVVQSNAIMDTAGNKLETMTYDGPGGDTLMFRITTDDSVSHNSVVGIDVVGPSFSFAAGSKRISFTEPVNESTLNSNTIWYKDATLGKERPLTLAISTEYTNLGKPFTVVTVTPQQDYTTGRLYVKLMSIKDTVGNYGVGINSSNTF